MVTSLQFIYLMLGILSVYLGRHLIMRTISVIFPFHKTILQEFYQVAFVSFAFPHEQV